MKSLSGFLFLLQTVSDDVKSAQDNAPAPADFTTMGGLQTKSLNFNGQEVDVTSGDSSEWRHLLDGRGLRSFDVSGSGIADDSELSKKIESRFVANKIFWWRIIRTDQANRAFTGKFKVSTFNYTGPHDGPLNYEISLMSSGPVTIA